MREKKLVNGVVVALSSVFDKEVLPKFNRVIDAALKKTDITEQADQDEGAPKKRSEVERSADAERSFKELSKLNQLLSPI